jgi:ureidoglycolate lyase
MVKRIRAEPLTAKGFAPYGSVIEAGRGEDRLINSGLCHRWHDQCRPDVEGGEACISVFEAEPRSLPHRLDLIERHPLGSQAFLPLTAHPFLVIAADDPEATPRAFLTAPHQGVQFRRGAWHGVLTPLRRPGLFAVIDYAGPEKNLEERRFDEPWEVTA